MLHEGASSHSIRVRGLRSWLILAGVLLVLVVILVVSLRLIHRQQSPFPASITNAVQFDLYYPRSLPSGYSLDPTHIELTDGVVTYQITGPSGTIFVSQQAVPNGFDFDQLMKGHLSKSRKITVPGGEVTTGFSGGQTELSGLGRTVPSGQSSPIASFVSDTTWVLLTASPTVQGTVVTRIATSLTK